MKMNLMTLISGFSLLFAVAGCNKASNAAVAQTTTSITSVSQVAAASPAVAKVTRIVFVGKEHPCDCTRKALDAGWAALQKALGTPSKVPVEKLQVDTDGDLVPHDVEFGEGAFPECRLIAYSTNRYAACSSSIS
jgi:hypothetical protein